MISLNKMRRLCFSLACFCLAGLPLWCADAGIVRTTVRVDRGSGRLVRTQVMLPREVPPVEVIARDTTPNVPVEAKVMNPTRREVDEIVEQSSATHGVDPLLVRSVMLGIKHSIAPMKARGGGAIVNTASVSGITTNGPAAYCTAKAAVIQLTRMAAMELAADRIRVNSVLPGLIATSIFGAGMGMTHDQSVKIADEMKKGMAAAQPLPKAGLPRDIAEAVLYLVSDASAFVTGTEIRVDGGIAIQPFMGDEQQPGNVSNLIATSAQKVTA